MRFLLFFYFLFIFYRTFSYIESGPWSSGYARAITSEQIRVTETKHPIIIGQNYVDDNRRVKVSDITFSGFERASTSQQATTLNCCSLGCTNIVMDHVKLSSMVPGKPLRSLCKNANGTSISTSPHVDCLSKWDVLLSGIISSIIRLFV